MFTTILLCALLGSAATGTNATPTPTTAADSSVHTQVRAQTFKQDNCGGAYEFLWIDPNVCYGFSDGVKSIRVIGKDGDTNYNACKSFVALETYVEVGSVRIWRKEVLTRQQ